MADNTKLTIELETVLRNLNRTLRGLDQIKRKLDAVANVRFNQRSSTAAVDRQAIAAQRLALQQQRLQLQQQRLSVQTQELANRQERARQAADRLTRANDRLTQSTARGSRVMPAFQQRLNSIGAAALRVGGGLRSMGASMAILVSGPLVALGRVAGQSAADIDAIRNRLIATEGSLEAANARLAQLRQLADTTVGVTRRTALDTFAILATLGDITEKTINDQIRAFGRLNAAFTIEDQQLFFRNLLQIFQQGFEVKDIKEAIGRVPIFNQLLQQAFGTSDPERLRELKAAGKLTLDTFLAGMATAVETDPVLSRIQESISVRFAKTFERLRDSLEPLGLAILGPLERIVVAVEPIILRISAAFAQLPPGIQTAIVAVGILTAAFGPVLFILGGIASGIGALATAAAAILPVLASIGLPAILAILGGLVIVIGEITTVVTVLGVAWAKNFLGVRELVVNAANAIASAFTRIRGVVNEVTQRILPTLQSIVTKVLGVITALWQTYGSTVVQVVGDVFRFVVRVTETFIRVFGGFVDLVLKLIDGDWRGAWRAFARIIVAALDSFDAFLSRLLPALVRTFARLQTVILAQAARFALMGAQLATQLQIGLSAQLMALAPKIRDALIDMLVLAVERLDPTSIAAVLVARFLAALRKAASEGVPAALGPAVGVDVGAGAGLFRRARRPGTTTAATGDAKGQRAVANQLAKLHEAQDKLDEQREENRLRETEAAIQQQFELAKAGLDREQRALGDSFEDRLKSIKAYFAERGRLETALVDTELAKEKGLSRLLAEEFQARRKQIEREFQTSVAEINQDQRLTGRAKQLALETAEINRQTQELAAFGEFEQRNAEVSTQILLLQQQRADITAELTRQERLLTEEIEKQKVLLRADLLDEQGRTADAESMRLRQRFIETLRDLRIDTAGLGVELQDALNKVDLTILQQRLDELPEPVRQLIELLDIGTKRAAIAEAQVLVENLSAGLRLDEERVQNRVLDGIISQREAQAEIVVIQQKYRALLLDILKGELAKAEAIKDQGLITAIQAQITETERLGVAIDEAGQRINQALLSDLQSGLSGIFSGARRGFEGLRDAAISFGERLLDTLNDIAATSILERIQGLFKPDATNTEGTVGGFISKLFGLQPKQAADAATASATLQTGATAATATFSTGVTTSAATFATTVATSAASFAATIIAAAAAAAAALTAGGVAGGAAGGLGGGLSGLLGGAATGLFPAVPGGVYKFVEGGHPEAVMTTDPKHFTRQLAILRAYLRETHGLGGRIKEFASGAFISPHEAQSMMLSGLSGPSLPGADVGSLAVAGTPSMMKLRQVLVDERNMGNWINSSEGEQVLVDFLYKHQPIIRKIGGR